MTDWVEALLALGILAVAAAVVGASLIAQGAYDIIKSRRRKRVYCGNCKHCDCGTGGLLSLAHCNKGFWSYGDPSRALCTRKNPEGRCRDYEANERESE